MPTEGKEVIWELNTDGKRLKASEPPWSSNTAYAKV
jgi:hypothetical protein